MENAFRYPPILFLKSAFFLFGASFFLCMRPFALEQY